MKYPIITKIILILKILLKTFSTPNISVSKKTYIYLPNIIKGKYYELVKYEVWYDKDNSQLMSDVADELGTEASGVPFIVIGDKYFSGFSATTSPEQLKNAIKEQYESKEYTDVVAAVKKGISIDKKNEKNSILPIVIVSSIAVVVVLALVFFTKEK